MVQKRILLFLVAVMMLLTVFVACQTTPGDGAASTGDETSSATGTFAPVELPDQTYNGYNFRVLSRPAANSMRNWPGDLFADAEDSTPVGAAVYRRNEWVCERLDCELTYTLSSSSNRETDAMDVLFAGEDAYDLLMPHGQSIMTYANEGYLLDWDTDLVWCDLDKPWWDQDAKETFSINNKLYVMNGDLSYMSVGFTFCMYFNKALMDDLTITYPYQLVRDGEWTWDVFYGMALQGTKDLDGNTTMDVGTDRFGYYTHEHGGSFQVMYATGSRLLLKDEDDFPYSPGVTEAVNDAYEAYYALIDSDNAHMYFNKDGDKKVDTGANQALFWDAYVGDMVGYGDYEFDFGVLPWPNFEENQEGYSCHVSVYVHEFGVPYTVSDPVRTSAILEALAYGGHTMVIDAYYEQTLQIQKTRDEESKEMVALIKESRAFDLGFFHESLSPLTNMGHTIASIPTHSLSAFYNKYQSQIETKVNMLIANYT